MWEGEHKHKKNPPHAKCKEGEGTQVHHGVLGAPSKWVPSCVVLLGVSLLLACHLFLAALSPSQWWRMVVSMSMSSFASGFTQLFHVGKKSCLSNGLIIIHFIMIITYNSFESRTVVFVLVSVTTSRDLTPNP